MSKDDKACAFRFEVGKKHPVLRELLLEIPVADSGGKAAYTDGRCIFIDDDSSFDEMVHCLCHLLLCHPFHRNDKYLYVFDIAADIAAECAAASLGFIDSDALSDAKALLGKDGDVFDVLRIYEVLMDEYEDELEILRDKYCKDEHFTASFKSKGHLFSAPDAVEEASEDVDDMTAAFRARVLKVWKELIKGLTKGNSGGGRKGTTPGSREELMLLRERSAVDFSAYLRRFSVHGEEMRISDDSFDQIPYMYGLEMYGDMPLVEPLEYSEVFKVRELVIAIDTSGSCSLSLVRRFLDEIRSILLDHDNFFKSMELHIVQCDAYIQDHRVIRDKKDWDSYCDALEIRGRRGTDFRPVFRLTDSLIEDGTFRDLRGVIYFTDGAGVYPEKEPGYESAFVYPGIKEYDSPGIPEWVTKLCMDLPAYSTY